MSKLSIMDAAFLALETAANPKHVAGLAILDPGTDGATATPRDLLQEMKDVVPEPPFNKKLDWSLLSMPRWVEDPDTDLDWHVRHIALPAGADIDDLMLLVSQLHSTLLDRSRPLWEFYLIEGFEGHKFALYLKVHHAYMDGVSMSKRVTDTLNTSATDTSLTPVWGTKQDRPKIAREDSNLLQQLIGGVKGAGALAKSVPAMSGLAAGQILKAVGVKKDGIMTPFSAPRTRLNEPLRPARSAAVAKMTIARLKSVASAADVTVNDVLLSLCDSALLAYLEKAGEPVDKPLVAQMPISVRSEGSDSTGNQITIALVELSSGGHSPVERLKQISRRAADVKNQYGRLPGLAASNYTVLVQSLAQVVDVVKANRLLPPLGNVLVSNVIGPKEKLYLKGAKLIGLYPISTMPPGVSVNITFLSTGGVAYAGIVAGREAIADAAFVAREMEKSLAELSRSLKKQSGRNSGVRKKK